MYRQKLSSGFKWRPRLGLYTDGTNNTFDKEYFEARSYNHWLYCTKIKGKVVFNTYHYSTTTSNHQSNLKALLKSLKIKIDVKVSMRSSLSSFTDEALPTYYEEMFEIEIKGTRARKDGVYVKSLCSYFKTRKKAIAELKKTIALCRKLGAKMPQTEIKELKARLVREDKSDLEYKREESKAKQNLVKQIKPMLKDFGPIDLGFESTTDLTEINF